MPARRPPDAVRAMPKLLAALVLTLCIAVGISRAAQAQVLTLAQYDRKLAIVQAAADAYATHPPASVPAHMGTLGTAPIVTPLMPILRCAVLLPATKAAPGTIVIVDNRPVLITLGRIDRARSQESRNQMTAALRDQLALLRAQTKSVATTDFQGLRAAQAARTVLSAKEFSSDPVPPPSYLERQTDKFSPWLQKQWDKLARLFHFSPGPSLPDMKIDPRVPEGILITIVIIAGGLLVAFVARLVTQANWTRLRQSRSSAAETGLALTAEEEALVAARDFDRLLALAKQRADGGDFRSAFRLVYLASLVTLDQQGLVRLNKSRTNWEYLRAVRQTGNDSLYDALLPMTRGFDRIWYGLRPATRADYEQALSGHSALRGQAGVS